MKRGPCRNDTCTFNMTKVCVLGHAPDACPQRPGPDEDAIEKTRVEGAADGEAEAGDAQAGEARIDPGGSVLATPPEPSTLPASRTLGITQANAMMERKPTCMIGLVGLPGAGKTACLVSAYLLLAKGKLDGFSYADSETLRAFEEIARGSRTWVIGNPPDQMTAHTILSDDREAGFLHLCLRLERTGGLCDVLLPDLPGEWSKELIDRDEGTRFGFLRSAGVIWLMVDGRRFTDQDKVAYARYRATLLIERLAKLLRGHNPRLIVVPTWRDAEAFPPAEADVLLAAGAASGFDTEIVSVASFSWHDGIKPGHGIARLIERSIRASPTSSSFWPVTPAEEDDRQIAAYRRRP